MEGLVEEMLEGARTELDTVLEQGGAVEAVPYMKARLVDSHRERVARIESGDQTVIGQNSFTETEDSPLTVGEDGGIMKTDPEVERERIDALENWKEERDAAEVEAALAELAEAARDETTNIMPASIRAAKAGVTTGEWSETLREVFGPYRAPTGVSGSASPSDAEQLAATRERVKSASDAIGRPIRILVGKPGLDGHSNGAEQIAVRARDVGMEVIYEGIRLTPAQIASSALEEDVDVVGLSILSGSHRELVPQVVNLLRESGSQVPVVVGGIIPPDDARVLTEAGVARVYTPKDFDLNRIMGEIAELVAENDSSTQPQPA
jgi:(2R)-ethylmalonyl-CoA mutase